MSDLLGTFVIVTIPHAAIPDDCDQINGTITGVGGVLVQVTTDSGYVFYRHKDKHLAMSETQSEYKTEQETDTADATPADAAAEQKAEQAEAALAELEDEIRSYISDLQNRASRHFDHYQNGEESSANFADAFSEVATDLQRIIGEA